MSFLEKIIKFDFRKGTTSRAYFLCLALLLLTACTSGGYSRSYILSEGSDQEVEAPQPAEHRQ